MFELALVIAGLAFMLFVDGWSLSVVWNWFIPNIFGLTTLTIVQAIGVMLVARLINGKISSKDKPSTEEVIRAIVKNSFISVFFVGIGFVVTLFL